MNQRQWWRLCLQQSFTHSERKSGGGSLCRSPLDSTLLPVSVTRWHFNGYEPFSSVCLPPMAGYRKLTRWSSSRAHEETQSTRTGWRCWRRRWASTKTRPARLRQRWRDCWTSYERSRPRRTTRTRRSPSWKGDWLLYEWQMSIGIICIKLFPINN